MIVKLLIAAVLLAVILGIIRLLQRMGEIPADDAQRAVPQPDEEPGFPEPEEPADDVDESVEEPDADEASGQEQRSPTGSGEWTLLVDTGITGTTDMDLLYLESVLHAEGIATEFSPTRPGGLLDPWGRPIRSQMFVDTAKLAEARQIALDLLPTNRNDQGGPGTAAGQ